jgi:hypothetical protein
LRAGESFGRIGQKTRQEGEAHDGRQYLGHQTNALCIGVVGKSRQMHPTQHEEERKDQHTKSATQP